MKKETKRILSVLLALVMLFSLFPASAFADAGGEPEENEGQIAPVEESAPSENEGEIAPIDEPAPAEEPEELRKPYTLSGRALTFKANGTPDTSNTGGAILVASTAGSGESVSAEANSVVTCQTQAADGYRLVAVYFGSSSAPLSYDVTSSKRAIMPSEAAVFTAVFIPEGANMPCRNAGVILSAPPLGGSYSGLVSADVTKYFNKDGAAYSALNAYSVSAVWKEEGGANPTSFQIGKSYYAVITVTFNSGWSLGSGFQAALTMPDGSTCSDFVMEKVPGGVSFHSPLYTVSSDEGYHNLYAATRTYDENGNIDASLTGGTVTLSTGAAKAGDPVSCTVTTNPGYRLLAVQFALQDDEPVEDVTDTREAVMWDRDMEFRAFFIQDGGSLSCFALAVQLGNPKASGYRSLPAAPALTPYLSMTSLALYPTAFSVTDASWRNANGECIGWFYDVQDYYALFTLRPNPGWTFADNSLIELTMPDGSILRNTEGDFTATPNADGSITVKSPMLHVPNTVQPTGGAIPVVFRVEVYDADYHLVPDVIGGTASYSPANPHPGDTVTVTASPAPGYQLQYVYYDNGLTMGYDATAEMSFTVPEDYGGIELSVCFTPVGTSLPLPSTTQKVELPVLGTQNSGSGRVLNGEHHWYDVESVTWFGGAGSGCQGQEPTRFLPGASYYAEVVLTPHAHWHWKPDTNLLMLYHDPSDPDPNSVNWDLPSGSTCSVDAQGRLHVVGEEIMLPGAVPIRLYQYTEGSDGGLLNVVGGTVKFSVNGGTAQTLPASNELMVLPGDQISLSISPNTGYRLQSANWGIGDEFAGDITETLAFTVPEDCSVCEVIVYFAPADAVIPIDRVFLNLPLPLPASSYSAGATQAENENLDNFDIVQTFWYGGTDSGCQNAFPSSFISGASYYARILLVPKDNWCFAEGTQVWIRLEDGSLVEAKSTSFDAETGQFLIETYEYPIYTRDILQASVELEMFEEGGSYTGAVPAVVTAPEGAHYTVSSAYWYNYDSQESGGVGIAPGFFSRDGRYYVEFLLVPDEGYTFQWTTQVSINPGKWENRRLNSDGSLSVYSSWYSLDEETAALRRRVRITNQIMNADGTLQSTSGGNYVLVNDYRPMVGDTLYIDPVVKNGYRLQWVTISRHSEIIGQDYTESLSYTVEDEPGDVYIWAVFAADDEPVAIQTAALYLHYPSPGGSYSGSVPANVTPDYYESQYTIQRTRWYLLTNGQASDPKSFEVGKTYAAEIVLAHKEGWVFTSAPSVVVVELDDGSCQFLPTDGGQVSLMADGTVIVTTAPITLPETAVDSVELSLDLPEEGDSFEFMSQPWATIYTPHAGEMYTIWKNGADQATGEEDSQTASFQPGCVYYATIRLHADQGYYLTEDTRVTLRNGLSFTTQYSTTDRSLWIHTESITIPTDRYQLSGTYVTFRLNDVEVTSARPGEYVVARSDITTQPLETYLANVTSEDVELTQITEITWGFTMPEKDVTVTGELLPQETYIFELEDGIHEMNAKDALWLFGEQEAGYRLEKDLTGDGNTDIYVDFYDDGTARVVRVGNICGDLVENTPSGRIGTIIYRFGPERYDVYLGGVQITAGNRNNVPVVSGSASYDPETRTLTLNDVTAVNALDSYGSDMVRSYFIVSSGDLTVKGSANLQSDHRGGVYCGGNLTLDGNFEFSGEYGIYAEKNLNATGVLRVYAKSDYAVYARGNAVLMDCKTFLQNSEGEGLYCGGNMAVSGDFSVNAIGRGLYCGVVFNFVNGFLYVVSSNDIGVQVNGPLVIMDGFFGASGKVQAIQADELRIPSTHIIEKPTNGVLSSDGSTVTDPSTNSPATQIWINGQSITIELGVKDLDGNEGVGGTVAFNNGGYATQQTGSFALNTEITIRAQADDGYAFDHWETSYGGFCSDELLWKTTFAFAENPKYYAVFEELLPIDEAHFPDDNFRSYLTQFDEDGDGYLSRTERQAVTRIEAPSMNIADLKGIGYFPELTYLDVRDNKLQRLDLTGNPKLDTVHCHQNPSLATLNVTKCPELRILQCYSTSLANLNLNYNTKLESLVCNATRLVTLDLSQCRVLKAVLCQNCSSLKQLHLNSDNLKRLSCYGTKLQQLDLSACSIMSRVYHGGSYTPASTNAYDEYWLEEETNYPWFLRIDPALVIEEGLGIPVNRPNFPDDDFRAVVSSDVDSNKNDWLSPMEIANAEYLDLCGYGIASLQGIHFLSGLKDFDAEDNRITELDLSGNPGLEAVDLCHNPLRSLNLDGLTKLRSLICYDVELESLDLLGCPILLDAYLNGTRTEYEDRVEYRNGPLGGVLIIDKDLEVITGLPGDINGDGQVDNRDVTRLLRFLRYPNVTVVEAALDVNGDGEVNNLDAETLIRYLRYGDVEIH